MWTSILLLFPEYSSNTLSGDVAAYSTAVGHSSNYVLLLEVCVAEVKSAIISAIANTSDTPRQ